jgi:hypothetical protein
MHTHNMTRQHESIGVNEQRAFQVYTRV